MKTKVKSLKPPPLKLPSLDSNTHERSKILYHSTIKEEPRDSPTPLGKPPIS
jgi:hypothetical protein